MSGLSVPGRSLDGKGFRVVPVSQKFDEVSGQVGFATRAKEYLGRQSSNKRPVFPPRFPQFPSSVLRARLSRVSPVAGPRNLGGSIVRCKSFRNRADCRLQTADRRPQQSCPPSSSPRPQPTRRFFPPSPPLPPLQAKSWGAAAACRLPPITMGSQPRPRPHSKTDRAPGAANNACLCQSQLARPASCHIATQCDGALL